MAKSVGGICLLASIVLLCAWADKRIGFGDEQERRWNTPPELTPESVVKTLNNGELQARLLTPVTATLSLSAGHNNAHSVSLGASLDGISLSESNSYNHPAGYGADGSLVSVSKSATVSAGLSGISTAGAEAYSNGNNANTKSHSLSFGQATATSFGAVENGRAITGSASSVGVSQSSAATHDDRGQFFSRTDAVGARYPKRPMWDNVGPVNEYNERHLSRPTLTISKPHDRIRPTLNIDAHDASRREQRPTIRIYKWRPNNTVFPRPSLSIEHRELQPHGSWNSETYGPTGLQVGVSSGSASYEFSASEKSASQIKAVPWSLESSVTNQASTSGQAQNFASSVGHSSTSPGYVSENAFGEGHSRGTSTSSQRSGSSVARVNAQAAAGNGHAQGIASSEAGSFVRFPEGGSVQYVGGETIAERKHSDDDILSDLAQTVGELLDIV